MLYGAGGLEGRERPSKGLQRKDATSRSVLKRHRGEAPVEYSVSQGQADLRNAVLRGCNMPRKSRQEWILDTIERLQTQLNKRSPQQAVTELEKLRIRAQSGMTLQERKAIEDELDYIVYRTSWGRALRIRLLKKTVLPLMQTALETRRLLLEQITQSQAHSRSAGRTGKRT